MHYSSFTPQLELWLKRCHTSRTVPWLQTDTFKRTRDNGPDNAGYQSNTHAGEHTQAPGGYTFIDLITLQVPPPLSLCDPPFAVLLAPPHMMSPSSAPPSSVHT